MSMEGSNVCEATHVKVNDQIEKIVSKWGVGSDGSVAKSFGVVTKSGRRVSMWEAQSYFKDKEGKK